jgi:predicted nucleic acid-binding protein
MNQVLHVPSPERIPALIPEDPSDDLFLALAVENQARLIVSSDQHLLALKACEGVPIVTPGEAVEVVTELLAQ